MANDATGNVKVLAFDTSDSNDPLALHNLVVQHENGQDIEHQVSFPFSILAAAPNDFMD